MLKSKYSGILCVFAAFFINFLFGGYFTFGNLMPYFVSYMRSKGIEVTYADFAKVLLVFYVFDSVGFLLGSLLRPLIGSRAVVFLGSALFAGGCFLTRWSLETNLGAVIVTMGVMQGLGTIALSQCWTVPME